MVKVFGAKTLRLCKNPTEVPRAAYFANYTTYLLYSSANTVIIAEIVSKSICVYVQLYVTHFYLPYVEDVVDEKQQVETENLLKSHLPCLVNRVVQSMGAQFRLLIAAIRYSSWNGASTTLYIYLQTKYPAFKSSIYRGFRFSVYLARLRFNTVS